MDSNFNISSILIISWLLIQTAAFSSIQDSSLSSLCTPTIDTTSDFDDNLNDVLTKLADIAPLNNGYSTASSFLAGNYGDFVFGLALCRRDVSIDNCKACLSNAKDKIIKDCPNNRRAIIWYDHCYVKFADYSFYGEIDTKNTFSMRNADNVPHPRRFYEKAAQLLGDLSGMAGDKDGKFAHGHVSLDNPKIYAMAQCSKDLSNGDCKKCLETAKDKLPGFSRTSMNIPLGGRSYTGSCYLRYEVKSFLY